MENSIKLNKTYFDLGFIPDNNTRIETKFSIEDNTKQDSVILGSFESFDSTQSLCLVHKIYGNAISAFFGGKYYNYAVENCVPGSGLIVEGEFSGLKYNLNGSERILNGDVQNARPFHVGDTTITETMYYIKIYQNDILIYDLVPFMNSDGYGCLKDKVSGAIYNALDPSKVEFIGILFGAEVSKSVFSYNQGEATITITTENEWTANSSDWITLSKTAGTGDDSFSFSIPENTGNYREGYIEVSNGEETISIPIIQKQNLIIPVRKLRIGSNLRSPELSLDVHNIKANSFGGENSVHITSNTSWSVECSDSWLHADVFSGKYDGDIVVSVDETSVERNGTVTITAQNELGSVSQVIDVLQVVAYYTLDLRNEWRLSSDIPNPDSNVYDGVYESFSNRGIVNSEAKMTINLSGYDTFKILARSNGENNYDYLTVLDVDRTSVQKTNFKGKANQGTSLSDYTEIVFDNLGGTEHFITLYYSKDGSSDSGTDSGYLLIPKNQ